jgi:hypothetical protein
MQVSAFFEGRWHTISFSEHEMQDHYYGRCFSIGYDYNDDYGSVEMVWTISGNEFVITNMEGEIIMEESIEEVLVDEYKIRA